MLLVVTPFNPGINGAPRTPLATRDPRTFSNRKQAMSTVKVRKPGYMLRAVIAWCIFNGVLLATLGAVVYVLGDYRGAWFVQVLLILGVIASEWQIMGDTIAPIIKDWIVQEEWVDDTKVSK